LTTRTQLLSFRRTKLYRPPVADDHVSRERLEDRLGRADAQQIIVVSAPAGYGKTAVISHWVDQSAAPCAWLSLDTHDNDLRLFLQYLAAAFSEWCPSAARSLEKIIESQELPSPSQVADACVSEIDRVKDPLVLVLDDYHSIRETEVHDLVSTLLNHMPACLRVAIVSRRRPPLSLSRLRSQNLVIDIGLQDLQFNDQDTRALVSSTTNTTVDDQTLSRLHAVTEGWPAGLRMVLLALPGNEGMQAFLDRCEGTLWQIQEYLVEEVINQLPNKVADSIYRTSILDRFSADLCGAMIDSTDDAGVSGKQVVELIQSRGLFCIPLDEKGEWFRYHHFFQELLLTQARLRYNEAEIRSLHTQAGAWFDREGRIEEALQHYFHAEDNDLAAAMILRHKDQLILEHQWRRLDLLMRLLPTETVDNNLELLVLMSWVSGRMGRVSQELGFAQIARERIERERQAGTVNDVAYGQNCAQCSVVEYFSGDGRAALALADKALELLPLNHTFARSEATLMRSVSLQMLGDANAGQNALLDSIEQPGSETEVFRARILIGSCYLNWTNGSLRELQDYATTLLELGQSTNDDHAIVHACWFSGAALYHLNKLDAAADVIGHVIRDQWWPHQESYSNCVQIMSQIHAARGEYSRAHDLYESLVGQSLESRSTYHLANVHALQAELAHARGDEATAFHWATNFRPEQVTAGYSFSVAALLAARILLCSEQMDAQEKAETILSEHQSFYESTNNIRFLIETLALRAMLCAKNGDEDTADQLLGRVVSLAEPGAFVRLFVDLGPTVIPLLNRLELTEPQLKYVGTILAGFPIDFHDRSVGRSSDKATQNAAGLPEPLSKRENEVLELLAKRLTNKEIGERLFISPDTVKRHAHNIFTKLNVSSRREARAKAIGLGIVSNL